MRGQNDHNMQHVQFVAGAINGAAVNEHDGAADPRHAVNDAVAGDGLTHHLRPATALDFSRQKA